MTCHRFSWLLLGLLVLGVMSACIKEIPLPPAERDAVSAAITQAVRGNMDIMAFEQVSVARTPAYLRIALKPIPDKVPQSKNALRAYLHSTSMDVIRQVAQNHSLTGIEAIQVEYYSTLTAPGQETKGRERVRLFYSTGIRTEKLNKANVSTFTDDQLAALVTHTLDDTGKLDLPN